MVVPELQIVADALKHGKAVEPVRTRVFLSWFDAQRRGIHVVRNIREQMYSVGVQTKPDFEEAWLDLPIAFHLDSRDGQSHEEQLDLPEESVSLDENRPMDNSDTTQWIRRDPTYRISKLKAANAGVERVSPNDLIETAVSLMLARDYSQLPVMDGERNVRGLISWRSIGSRMAFGNRPIYVRDALEPYSEVYADTSIFDAIPLIVRHGHVIVRSRANIVTGIVTASDLSLQFRTLTEPFLVLSEIENLVRNLIGSRFTAEELAEVRDTSVLSRQVTTVNDLTFGEYVRLLEMPERWQRIGLTIDRVLFCKDLDRVRKIRNDVMHFDPDGITDTDLSHLQLFAQFLQRIEELRGANEKQES